MTKWLTLTIVAAVSYSLGINVGYFRWGRR